jgi:gamma-glutamylcyclotransferase (GGCT)/AIG2-like uncharacterized protein YtfP
VDIKLKDILNEEHQNIYYFAYGSNMDVALFESKYKSAKALELVYLTNYKLTFDKYSESDKSVVADVIKENGHKVFGILYRMSINDIPALDKQESGYIKERDIVTDGNGNTHRAYFYSVSDKHNIKLIPNVDYTKKMMIGLRDALKIGPAEHGSLQNELKIYIKHILDINKIANKK